MSAAGLILAAGQGTRFGDRPKQLAALGGRPLLQWAVDAQCDVDPVLLDPVVVVLGAQAATVRAGIDPRRARVVVCERWGDGQSASLQRGLEELSDADRPVLVTLGDVPFVSPAVIARFAAMPAPARATYAGRPGHPVLLGPAEIDAVAHDQGDRGARHALRDVVTVELGGECRDDDVDTPDDLEALRRFIGSTVSPPHAG